ncbi:MAG TPA: hypothetical protein VGN57_19530 [Pirellulaceae bacterium]|jgi:hypothetical protein|nr:hypothetical protein [Pirellulaceae bacterium]
MHEAFEALPWLAELKALVEAELAAYPEVMEDRRPALQAELERLQGQIHGWTLSLGNPSLPLAVRSTIEGEFATAHERVQEIEDELRAQAGRCDAVEESVDPETVLEYVRRLEEVLAEECPTLGNLELSLHIERIDCFPDGHAEMRTCKLGSMPMALALLLDVHADPPKCVAPRRRPEISRRRARLRVDRLDERADELLAAADMAADPDRFAGLPEDWFWTDTFLPLKSGVPCWSVENAERVAKFVDIYVAEHGEEPSGHRLGREFGVSPVTATRAVAIARGDISPATSREPRSDSVRVKGNAELEAEILRLYDVERLEIKVIAERIGCGKKAVTEALDRTYAAQGRVRADARRRDSRVG